MASQQTLLAKAEFLPNEPMNQGIRMTLPGRADTCLRRAASMPLAVDEVSLVTR